MDRPTRIEPGPGQESVWDYPRPPAAERTDKHVVVRFGGRTVADTRRAVKVTETSHPPAYYVPPEDIKMDLLEPTDRRTFCEFKGSARYFTVRAAERVAQNAAWAYPEPAAGYEQLRDHVAFYPERMDECLVDDEVVRPQAGDFYGGWVTSDVVGPFKGEPGTEGW